MREDTAKQALEHIGSVSYVSLVSLPERSPVWLRATLLRAGARFYLCAFTDSGSVFPLETCRQYAVQFSLKDQDGKGYVELHGQLRKVVDWPEKRVVAEVAGSLGDYWYGFDDPSLTMYELKARSGLYRSPGSGEAREFQIS